MAKSIILKSQKADIDLNVDESTNFFIDSLEVGRVLAFA